MKGLKTLATGFSAVALFACAAFVSPEAAYAEAKIGVVNVQKVLDQSSAGKRAKSVIETKMKSYETTFKKDREALKTMRDELEKKSASWSDSVKQEKFGTFQKKSAELANKERAAAAEMNKLRERHAAPVMKKLDEVIQSVGKSGGYDLVLPAAAVVYASGPMDITDQVVKALDAAMK